MIRSSGNYGKLSLEELEAIKELALTKRLRNQIDGQPSLFDISLSGTCATIVIQLPKRLIVGWAGDSAVTIHTTDRIDRNVTKPVHTPEDPIEKMRIYKKGAETREEFDG